MRIYCGALVTVAVTMDFLIDTQKKSIDFYEGKINGVSIYKYMGQWVNGRPRIRTHN